MKLLISILIAVIFWGCTQIENDYVTPDSAPYKFSSIQQFSFDIPDANCYFFSFPSNHYQIDYLYQFVFFENNNHKILKAFSNYLLGYPFFDRDQSNFILDQYSNVKKIFQIPYIEDFNGNGSPDEIFQIEYEDHTVVQIRDHWVPLNDTTGRIDVTDIIDEYSISSENSIDSNTIFSNTITKEDNHTIRFTGVWKPAPNKTYLVFNKDNRIVRKKYKDLDSLIFIDPRRREVRKIETQVPLGCFTTDNSNIISSQYLLLKSGAPKNGHNKGQFKDYNEYLFVLDTNFNLKYIRQLVEYGKINRVQFFSTDKNYGYLIMKNSDNAPNYSYIEKIDLATGQTIKSKEIYFLDDFYALSVLEHNDNLFFYSGSTRLIINKITFETKTEKMPVDLHIVYTHSGLHTPEITVKEISFKGDINQNGFPDVFITSKHNQLLCIDGKTNEVLAASPIYQKPFNWAIARAQHGNLLVATAEQTSSKSYLIEKTPFWTRVLTHYSEFQIAGIFLFIPVLAYFIYRFYIISILILLLTQKSRNNGICLIKKGWFSKNYKVVNCNRLFKRILDLKSERKKKLNFDNDLPKEMKKNILDSFHSQRTKSFDETIYKEQVKYLNYTCYIIKPFYRSRYCLLSLTDSTHLVKSKLLDTAIEVVHSAKSGLGTIQTRLDGVFYKANQFEKEKEWFKKQQENIDKGINNISQTLKKLLYSVNATNTSLEKLNLNDFLREWFKNNAYRYDDEDLQFHFDLKPIKDNYYDKNQLGILIQCAVDNAYQSMYDSQEKLIIIKTFYEDNKTKLEITDTGIGMDQDFLKKLLTFGKSDKIDGTGLGLKLIKKVCDVHNADLEIVSERNVGTTLIIKF